MKKNTSPQSEMSRFLRSEEGYLHTGPLVPAASLEAVLQAVEGALLCIDEGNTSRAAHLLYSALPEDRKPVR